MAERGNVNKLLVTMLLVTKMNELLGIKLKANIRTN